VRIDQLLHRLCLARSRSLAARACRERRILVNGAAVRASRDVREGDRIAFLDPVRGGRRELELLVSPERQVSRREAAGCYRWLAGCGAPAGEEQGDDAGP